ncbi:MAG: twin-arginine translocation pathway signal protein [Betaproteobacteria bacterium]|nr:MAG: twin-arginine translocation pathway signal protein [Betaproteobacteria bacterium]
MSINRRQFVQSASAIATLASLGISSRASAQAQAIESLKVIVGFAAGGTADATARRLAQRLSPGYAKTAVVENRTGAGGQIAVQAVKGQPADGSMMFITPMSILAIYPHTYRKLPYDPVADFQPISMACVFEYGLAVGPAVPASVTNIEQFAAWCKANPDKANYGSPAAGSQPHFVAALFGRAAGIDYKHIPYRGTQPAVVDLLGGNISSVSGPVGDFLQHLPTGRIRILATSGAARSRFTPTVPTYTEQGMKDFVFSEWFGAFVVAKTPTDIVGRLSAACREAINSKDYVDAMSTFGLEARATSPEQLAAALKSDTERWAPLVKQIGFTADA